MTDAAGAARLGDEVTHGVGMAALIGGALLGAVVGAAIVAAGVATGGLAIVAIAGGCIAGGALSARSLISGIMKIAHISGPTSGALGQGSPNVRINGRPAMRAGVDYAPSCSGTLWNHFTRPHVLIAEGSGTVRVNGMPMARVGDRLACGAQIKSGSGNVRVGGPTVQMVPVHDNEETVAGALEVLGFVALGAAGLGALAAGGLATIGFIGLTGGTMFGFGKLKQWGDSLGPGYGDLMVGVAGFALMGLGARGAKTPEGQAAIDVLNRTEVTSEGLGANGGNIKIGLRPETEKPILPGDPDFIGPVKPSKISDSAYKSLRGKTPTQAIRDNINAGEGPKFDPVYGYETPTLEADHIVPMKSITEMPNFEDLQESEQLDVLNNEDNFMGLGKPSNTSKGAKEWGEWPGHSQLGPIPEGFNDAMIDHSAEIKSQLQQQINDIIRNRKP